MGLKLRRFFRKRHDNTDENGSESALSLFYLSHILQEEKDGFINFLLSKNQTECSFRKMGDTDAMLYINSFRATEWYRRYRDVCELEKNIDSSAEVLYKAREGVWNGNVKIATDARWRIKGYCTNCGCQIGGSEHIYADSDHKLCAECFSLFERYTPVVVNYCPGSMDSDERSFYIWKGWDDFVRDYPLGEGWHYEHHGPRIIRVKDDHTEGWISFIHHPDILKEVRENCIPWRRS